MRQVFSVHGGVLRVVIRTAMWGAILLTAPVVHAQEQVKIGIVDLDRILVESDTGKALQGRLEEFSAGVQSAGEDKAKRALEIRQRIADGSSTLSEEKLAELRSEYDSATAEMQQFRAEKQREGETMRQQGLREIEQRLQPILEAIRDEGDYDLILNYAPGVVLMLDDRLDLTAQVVQRLNAAATE